MMYIPPTSFTRFLYEQGVNVELGRWDNLRRKLPKLRVGHSFVYTITGRNFWELYTSHFHIDKDYHKGHDIYNILLGYMEPRLSPRTRRQQTLFHFINNTIFSITGGVTLVAGRFVQEYFAGTLSDITIVWSVIISFLSVFVVYMLTTLFGYQEANYVSNLITEYYIDRVEAGDVDDLSLPTIQTKLDEVTQKEQ